MRKTSIEDPGVRTAHLNLTEGAQYAMDRRVDSTLPPIAGTLVEVRELNSNGDTVCRVQVGSIELSPGTRLYAEVMREQFEKEWRQL